MKNCWKNYGNFQKILGNYRNFSKSVGKIMEIFEKSLKNYPNFWKILENYPKFSKIVKQKNQNFRLLGGSHPPTPPRDSPADGSLKSIKIAELYSNYR